VLQELDDLFELVLGFVHASHIGEPDLHLVVSVDFRAAPRDRHHPAFGAAHAPEEEAPDAKEENERNYPAEAIRQPPVHRLALLPDAVRLELFDEFWILDA